MLVTSRVTNGLPSLKTNREYMADQNSQDPFGSKEQLPQTVVPPTAQSSSNSGPQQAVSGQQFSSSIRTMQSDILSAKQGHAPTGLGLQRPVVPVVPVPPVITPSALRHDISSSLKPPLTPPPVSFQNLPKQEIKPPQPVRLAPEVIPSKAVELTVPKMPPTNLPTPPESLKSPVQELAKTVIDFKVPPSTGGLFGSSNLKLAILGLFILIIVISGVWYFFFRSDKQIVIQPSPTPVVTETPSPTAALPVSLERYFAINNTLNIDSGSNFITRLRSLILNQSLALGDLGLYKVNEQKSGSIYKFSTFMADAGIQIPAEVTAEVDDSIFYLSLTKKINSQIGTGFLVKLNDQTTIAQSLSSWESQMTSGFKDLFQYKIARAASTTMLDNSYQGFAIRYKNFPDHNSTIDYAVVKNSTGDWYLVFTNSREHMFAIIDRLLAGPLAIRTSSPSLVTRSLSLISASSLGGDTIKNNSVAPASTPIPSSPAVPLTRESTQYRDEVRFLMLGNLDIVGNSRKALGSR